MHDEQQASARGTGTSSPQALPSVLEAAAQLFGRPVTADENFFDLGGNSLTAIRLIALVRADGWHLETDDVFDQPDMAALAATAVRDAGSEVA